MTGLATANYDSVPLVCFTGQVARHLIGNDAFQEVDIVGITRSITKYGVTVRNREDLGRIIKEAFYIARTGRPGPVLIDLPKDVMAELGSAEYPKTELCIRDRCNLVIWLVGFVLYRILMHVDFALGNTLPDMVLTVLICLAVNLSLIHIWLLSALLKLFGSPSGHRSH